MFVGNKNVKTFLVVKKRHRGLAETSYVNRLGKTMKETIPVDALG